MPSFTLSDATPKDDKDKNNNKTTKNQSLIELEPEEHISKKSKKSSKLGNPPVSDEDGFSGKKAMEKRKTSDFEMVMTNGDEENSETSSERVEPEGSRTKSEEKKKKKNKKNKKAKMEEPLMEEEEEKEVEKKKEKEKEKEEDPSSVSRFRISEALREKLKEKGIEWVSTFGPFHRRYLL